jgi:hypothetical protein
MSLLSICQDAAKEIGFPAPASVIGASDANTQQLLRLANKEGNILSRKPWEALVSEHTFLLATGDQDYALPADFRRIIPTTTWNRDNKRIVINPVTSQEWQFLKGWTTINGLNLRARIRNGEMEFEQTIDAAENGKTIAFEYISTYWAESSGGTDQTSFLVDTDVSKIDEEIMTQGVVWRFKKAKGLDWQSDYAEYKQVLDSHFAGDGGARRIRMCGQKFGEGLGPNISDRDYG